MASASLPSLPLEILYQITDKLSYGSHLALSLTCRELYHKVDAPHQPYTLPPLSEAKVKLYNMADLLEIEKWPEHSTSQDNYLEIQNPNSTGLFACHNCLRLRPAINFFYPKKSHGVRVLQFCCVSCSIERERDGLCIPCGVERKFYHDEMSFQVNKEQRRYLHVCNKCGDFEISQDGLERSGDCVECGVELVNSGWGAFCTMIRRYT